MNASTTARGPRTARTPWNRKNPYRARLVDNRILNGEGSTKEVRHYALDLGDSGIEYDPGDGLGVHPVNHPALVDAVLDRLGVAPDSVLDGFERPLADLLTHSVELHTATADFAEFAASLPCDGTFRELVRSPDFASWAWGRDVLDVLEAVDGPVDPAAAVAALTPLKHRTYSIASSPLVHPGRIHLTATTVRRRDTRMRSGACSAYLADRVGNDGAAGVFLVKNKSFRLPEPDVPIVMIGAGTGIAPFRAFLQHRRAQGASGAAWLVFGERHREHDFLYRDELDEFLRDGTVDRLDTAFSRDGSGNEKTYVQHVLRAHGHDLAQWIDRGAHMYVCGSIAMGAAVDAALRHALAEHRGLSPDDATEVVAELRSTKRYARDVY
ncbi:FAD-binding protein [Rhodococcus sp. HNM0569]|uniref:FAD-binding protein n=1 Tax=Rhodococcus sp. HNM0569 TaxID=2716340 RepID=UPI00146BA1BC|nr:FAD-binding protein [Rhodococcus sp. HNM0569]